MIVEFEKSFEKSLNKIHNLTILSRLKKIIIDVENSPSLTSIPNLIKLTGYSSYYRIRISDYRVGIELIDKNTVRFIIIAHRKDIYKLFP
jgi:mRNA interferase RelE/StbE